MDIARTPLRAELGTAPATTRMTREQSKANTRERLLGAARSGVLAMSMPPLSMPPYYLTERSLLR